MQLTGLWHSTESTSTGSQHLYENSTCRSWNYKHFPWNSTPCHYFKYCSRCCSPPLSTALSSRRTPRNKWTLDLTYCDSFFQVPSVAAIHKELSIPRKINIQETLPVSPIWVTHLILLKMIIQVCFLRLDNMKHCFIQLLHRKDMDEGERMW